MRGVLAAGTETADDGADQASPPAPAHLHGPLTLCDGLHQEVAR